MRTKQESLRSWGITLVRLMVGALFAMHGAQKLFMIGPARVAAGSPGGAFPCRGSQRCW